jgi:hypothetical protein
MNCVPRKFISLETSGFLPDQALLSSFTSRSTPYFTHAAGSNLTQPIIYRKTDGTRCTHASHARDSLEAYMMNNATPASPNILSTLETRLMELIQSEDQAHRAAGKAAYSALIDTLAINHITKLRFEHQMRFDCFVMNKHLRFPILK